MRSRAAIGNHPLHPALVALPVGAYFLALVADVAYLRTANLDWAAMAGISIGAGVATALIAAIAGFIDYSALPRGSAVRKVATNHMLLNLAQVGLYAASFYLRYTNEVRFRPETVALALAWLAFALLAAAGWLGGKLVFEHRAGVVEKPDEAKARP